LAVALPSHAISAEVFNIGDGESLCQAYATEGDDDWSSFTTPMGLRITRFTKTVQIAKSVI